MISNNALDRLLTRAGPYTEDQKDSIANDIRQLYQLFKCEPPRVVFAPSPKAAGKFFEQECSEATNSVNFRKKLHELALPTINALDTVAGVSFENHQKISIIADLFMTQIDRTSGMDIYLTMLTPVEIYWLDFVEDSLAQGVRSNITHINHKIIVLRKVLENVHAIIPLDQVCIVFDFPVKHTRNGSGRLHNETGPALEYSDGVKGSFWNGQRIPDKWVTGHPPLPVEVFNIRNMEQRLAACAIVGWDRIIDELDCTLIDENSNPEIGTLYHATMPGPSGETPWGNRHNMGLLKVKCGTGREFVLQVPMLQTALQANAWTYGLDPEDYKPEIRT